MKELRRKVILPVFQLSELTTEGDLHALKRVIKQGKGHPALTYHYRFVRDDQARRDFNYNLFPVVLDRGGVPWSLGTLYILSQLEAETNPIMTSYQSKADDLGAYKEWLDTQDRPDDLMFQFPKIKLRRPTYRYRGQLQRQIQAGEIAPATAKRRMGTLCGRKSNSNLPSKRTRGAQYRRNSYPLTLVFVCPSRRILLKEPSRMAASCDR
jgi:hypothetical protein